MLRKMIFLLIISLFSNTFSEEINLIELKNTIEEVIQSEKMNETEFQKENNIKYNLIQKREKKEIKNEEKKEITLESLKNEIIELKELIKKEKKEEEQEYISINTPVEDYLDFSDQDKNIVLSNYIEYINNYTNDLGLSKEINRDIEMYSRLYEIPPELVLSIIKTESNFNPVAVSKKGAYGLMQLTEEAANYLEVDRKTISDNIKGGVKLLRKLLDDNDNNLILTLASYNAGQGAVKQYNGVPPYPETKNYIEKVLEGMSKITKNEIILNNIDFNSDGDF